MIGITVLDSLSAAVKIQKNIRGFLQRKKIHFKTIGPGIINVSIKTVTPSQILGEKFRVFDNMRSGFEMMMTIINPKKVTLSLTTDQGSPDSLMKYLKQENATYGAVINGGFYAVDGFYNLSGNAVLGMHRFECTYKHPRSKYTKLNKNYDNTDTFFLHAENATSEVFEDYENTGIEATLNLKTQLPDAYKNEYGLIRITHAGTIDIQPMSSFKSDHSFDLYQKDAHYLLSSGPILLWDSQVSFTEEKLKDKRFQFEEVRKVFGMHPGSVPPGSFYHADQPNPRSAIALTPTEHLMMITVKGDESPDNRDGLTLPQFAQLMDALKLKVAVNLDGGYSACQGVYNKTSMFTPKFIKSRCNERILPCSIMAQEPAAVQEKVNIASGPSTHEATGEDEYDSSHATASKRPAGPSTSEATGEDEHDSSHATASKRPRRLRF